MNKNKRTAQVYPAGTLVKIIRRSDLPSPGLCIVTSTEGSDFFGFQTVYSFRNKQHYKCLSCNLKPATSMQEKEEKEQRRGHE